MAIGKAQQKNIQQMDITAGGGIYSELARVDARNNPMLVIGLGGTGIDAALRLKRLIGKSFKLSMGDDGRRKELPDNIRFLGFETNQDDIRDKEYEGVALDMNREYQNLTEPGINSLLNNPGRLPDYIMDWLDDVNRLKTRVKGGLKGANGVRQGGRLLLYLKMNEIVANLTNIITDLLRNTNQEKRLEVFILAGVSGGTGSGTFIDVPYIIRGIMESGVMGSFGSERLEIMGYIFTPDVLISHVSDPYYHNVLSINGYAALKELDYLMNIEQRAERFAQRYGDNLVVNTEKAPYDMCHLISATGDEGYIPPNPYDYCMNIAAEHIVNFMSEMRSNENQVFGVQAYSSNINTSIESMRTSFKPKYSANFIYSVIGATAYEMPTVDVMTYLAYKLFQRMGVLFENTPAKDDVEDFNRLLNLSVESMEMDFNKVLSMQPFQNAENKPQYDDRNILQNQARLFAEEKNWLDYAADEYRRKYGDLLEERMGEIKKYCTQNLFKEPSKGPFYAQRMLYQSNNRYCALESLKEFRGQADAKAKACENRISDMEYMADTKKEVFRKALVGKTAKRLDFINACRTLARVKAEKDLSQLMVKFYDDLYSVVVEVNNSYYQIFVDLLEELSNLFEKNGRYFTERKEEKKNNVTTYTWKLFDLKENGDKKIREVLDKACDEKDLNKAIENITAKMIDESEKWLKTDSIDIANFVNDFVNQQFSGMARNTMDDYLRYKFKDDLDIKKHISNEIIPKLSSNSRPLFPKSAAGKLTELPTWKMIIVPTASKVVVDAFEEAAKNGVSGFTMEHMLKSNISQRICWLHLGNGMPMCWHEGMYLYETKYTNEMLKNGELSIGAHIYQSKKKNWRNLPSPIPDKCWDEKYSNPYILSANTERRELFNRALEYGIVRIYTDECRLFALKEWDVAAVETMGEPSGLNEARDGKARLEALLNLWKEEEKTVSYPIFSSNITADGTGLYRESFIRCFELWPLAQGQIEIYEAILKKIAACDKLLESVGVRNKNLNEFVNALFTAAVKRDRSLYRYDADPHEEGWQLLNLNSVEDPDLRLFPDYALFAAFCGLDDRKRGIVKVKTDKRLGEATDDMVELAKKYRVKYRESKTSMDEGIVEFTDASKKDGLYDFYLQSIRLWDTIIQNNEA